MNLGAPRRLSRTFTAWATPKTCGKHEETVQKCSEYHCSSRLYGRKPGWGQEKALGATFQDVLSQSALLHGPSLQEVDDGDVHSKGALWPRGPILKFFVFSSSSFKDSFKWRLLDEGLTRWKAFRRLLFHLLDGYQ